MRLEIKDLHVFYGKIEAIKGVSIVVNQGEIVTLIGANGAGKTTMLKTISGIRPVTSGQILFDGQEINKVPAHERVELGISQAPEGRGIFPGMTVLENLEMGKFFRKERKHEMQEDLDRVYHLFPRLKERASQAGGTNGGVTYSAATSVMRSFLVLAAGGGGGGGDDTTQLGGSGSQGAVRLIWGSGRVYPLRTYASFSLNHG